MERRGRGEQRDRNGSRELRAELPANYLTAPTDPVVARRCSTAHSADSESCAPPWACGWHRYRDGGRWDTKGAGARWDTKSVGGR